MTPENAVDAYAQQLAGAGWDEVSRSESRDPTDFPRLPGSARISYESSRQSTSSQEVATYTAKCSPAADDAFYPQSLPAPDWDEVSRYESVDDLTKSD